MVYYSKILTAWHCAVISTLFITYIKPNAVYAPLMKKDSIIDLIKQMKFLSIIKMKTVILFRFT